MKEGERQEAEYFGGPINRNNQLRKWAARRWKGDEAGEAHDLPEVEVLITIKGGEVEIRLSPPKDVSS